MAKHNPGDGWHYIEWNWDSAGAILAHVEDLCQIFGLDYDTLLLSAYPDEHISRPGNKDREDRARPATREDVKAVLHDLQCINWQQLRLRLEEAIAAAEKKEQEHGN